MSAVLFLVLFAALFAAILRLARRDPALTQPERLVATATLALALLTALLFALGFLGHLRVPWVMGGVGVIAAAAWMIGRRSSVVSRQQHLPPSSNPSRFTDDRRLTTDDGLSSTQDPTPKPLFLVPLLLGSLAAFSFLSIGLRLPVIDYDGLSYHLGLALHMAQDGDFRVYPGESGYTNYFARGGELWMALTVMLTSSIRFVKVVQAVVLPLLALASYSAARALGADRNSAALAAAVPLCVPVALYQSNIPYVDLLANGWFCIAIAAVVGAARFGPSPMRLLWLFAAGGLGVAAKFNVAFLMGGAGVLAIALWGPRWWAAQGRWVLAGAALSAWIGLCWPIRNWTQFGSPIYPFAFEPAGLKLGAGPIPYEGIRKMPEIAPYGDMPLANKLWDSWTTIDFRSWSDIGIFGKSNIPDAVLFDPSFGYRGDSPMGGLGLAWLAFLLPATLIAVGWFATRLLDRTARFGLAAALAPAAAFALTIAPWWPRFSIFLPILGGVLAAALISHLPRPARLAASILLGSALAFDAATSALLNRDAEIIRRFRPTLSPIEFYAARRPGDPFSAAALALMQRAEPGDTVSYYTPWEPTFTGLFASPGAGVRLFPFPSVWPPPDSITAEEAAQHIRRERIRLLLTKSDAPADWLAMIGREGGRVVAEHGAYRIYEFGAAP